MSLHPYVLIPLCPYILMFFCSYVSSIQKNKRSPFTYFIVSKPSPKTPLQNDCETSAMGSMLLI